MIRFGFTAEVLVASEVDATSMSPGYRLGLSTLFHSSFHVAKNSLEYTQAIR